MFFLFLLHIKINFFHFTLQTEPVLARTYVRNTYKKYMYGKILMLLLTIPVSHTMVLVLTKYICGTYRSYVRSYVRSYIRRISMEMQVHRERQGEIHIFIFSKSKFVTFWKGLELFSPIFLHNDYSNIYTNFFIFLCSFQICISFVYMSSTFFCIHK